MCTLSINSQYNGIELIFEARPAQSILDTIKQAGFRWHSVKKLWYAKNTAERLALAKTLSGTEISEAASVPASVPAQPVSKFNIKVGDILTASWGYSMTIVEFYKVTKIISATKIEIVELGHIIGDCDCGGGSYRMPDTKNCIGDPIQKIVSQSGYEKQDGRWHVKINSSVNLTPWDGRAKYMNTFD